MQTDLKALLEQLMDENDWEPIELVNDKGESARFNQIALLPTSVESRKYVDESVEHNFAILQPLDENDEEIGRPLVADISIDEDGMYKMKLVDDQILIHAVMAEYKEVRGITADDLADGDEESEEDGTDESAGEDGLDDPEDISDDTGDNEPSKEEKPKKRGFFSRLFGKKDD